MWTFLAHPNEDKRWLCIQRRAAHSGTRDPYCYPSFSGLTDYTDLKLPRLNGKSSSGCPKASCSANKPYQVIRLYPSSQLNKSYGYANVYGSLAICEQTKLDQYTFVSGSLSNLSSWHHISTTRQLLLTRSKWSNSKSKAQNNSLHL